LSDHAEFRRRSRIFLLVFVGFGTLCLGGALLELASVLSRALGTAITLGGALGGLAWMRWGLRWVREVQPSIILAPSQTAALDTARHRVVQRLGVVGFGVTWGIGMAGWSTWGAMPSHRWSDIWTLSVGKHLLVALVISIPLGLLAGYVWGRMMWALYSPKSSSQAAPPAA
jgi:hypothetical protein